MSEGTDAASFGIAARNKRVGSEDIILLTYVDGTSKTATYVQARYLVCTETGNEVADDFVRWGKIGRK